eukprot:CAMPEP_0196666600 /NCGR_PEP_ID=MMETSP1086-20130531/64605_1 /TAXON_ID=77921 /ORGANISM="Cyanoptyche  gloeocystis , Strain SAG4.97" /LENGTH=43 /DNA_ID= /DNA_START= /DNA_END= /DNA_ORIENTATION=
MDNGHMLVSWGAQVGGESGRAALHLVPGGRAAGRAPPKWDVAT